MYIITIDDRDTINETIRNDNICVFASKEEADKFVINLTSSLKKIDSALREPSCRSKVKQIQNEFFAKKLKFPWHGYCRPESMSREDFDRVMKPWFERDRMIQDVEAQHISALVAEIDPDVWNICQFYSQSSFTIEAQEIKFF